MQILHQKILRDGRVRMTVELSHAEASSPGFQLLPVVGDMHYLLGGQTELRVASHVLTEMQPTHWCSIEQRWIE